VVCSAEGGEGALAILVISVAVLVAGVRDGAERQQLDGNAKAVEVLWLP
jgi:hypothetical protein